MRPRGFAWPRLYDLLLLVLTRGRGRAYRDALLDVAGVAAGHRVLDVGCGTGSQALAAAGRVAPGGSVVGVDPSPEMLGLARRKARRRGIDVELRRAEAAALPFDDGSFDLVTITTVLHAVPERGRPACLAEAWRVLKRGGRLVLVDFAGDPDERGSWIARHGAHGRFDLGSLREPLMRAGFEAMEGGTLGWLDLHFLRATKREGPSPRETT